MTPVFERAKTFHDLERSGTVIGIPDKTSDMVKRVSKVSDSFCFHLRREPELPYKTADYTVRLNGSWMDRYRQTDIVVSVLGSKI
jgi:hypothetical protein